MWILNPLYRQNLLSLLFLKLVISPDMCVALRYSVKHFHLILFFQKKKKYIYIYDPIHGFWRTRKNHCPRKEGVIIYPSKGSLGGSDITATPSPGPLGHPPLSSTLVHWHPHEHLVAEFFDKLLCLLTTSYHITKNRLDRAESLEFPFWALSWFPLSEYGNLRTRYKYAQITPTIQCRTKATWHPINMCLLLSFKDFRTGRRAWVLMREWRLREVHDCLCPVQQLQELNSLLEKGKVRPPHRTF